jgi:hypothetical protein
MGGIAEEYITKLGCEKYFHRIHILSTTGDALMEISDTYSTRRRSQSVCLSSSCT